MTLAQFGTIQAADFNTLIGPNTVPITANTFNATWAAGNFDAGYGQTALSNVSVGNSVLATGQWGNLVNNISNAKNHQGAVTTLGTVTVPVSGGLIQYQANIGGNGSPIANNLANIYVNRLNCVGQSATTSATVTNTAGTWINALTMKLDVSFANADAARYFFNAGGQLAITFSHPNTATAINTMFNGIAANSGTVVCSAMNLSTASNTANIAGTVYRGVQKVGGGNPTPTYNSTQDFGYYSWSAANANIFTQTAATGPAGYTGSFIRVIVQTNGSNIAGRADRGNVITVYSTWDEIPNGLTVGINSAMTVTARPSEVANIANTWGTITIGNATIVSRA